MFCSKCGNEIKETAKFCPKCGTPIQQSGNAYQKEMEKVAVRKRPPYLAIGVIGILAVVVVLVLRFCIVSNDETYETPIKKFFQAVNRKDGEMIMSLYPKEMIKFAKDEGFSKETMVSLADKMLDTMINEITDGEDFNLEYEITDVENYSSKERKDTEDELNKLLKCNMEIEEVKEVTFDIKETISGETESGKLIVIKIGGKWYVHPTQGMF